MLFYIPVYYHKYKASVAINQQIYFVELLFRYCTGSPRSFYNKYTSPALSVTSPRNSAKIHQNYDFRLLDNPNSTRYNTVNVKIEIIKGHSAPKQ